MDADKQEQIQAHARAIAALLYAETAPEQLTTLEGIETAVRGHILEQVAFQIFEVGSPRDGETEALVVLPISQQCSLDFHLLREECKLDGLWFPFQL